MAGDVFISYRSTDVEVVDGLYEGLRSVGGFDRWQLWRDRNSLVAGTPFLSQIENATSRARVLVAVIGKTWNPKDSKGDWVTRELKAAFAHGVRVLPVLVGPTTLPHPDDLPEELAPLCEIQCLRITSPPTDVNCYALTDALRRHGVKPVRNTDPWSGVQLDTPVVALKPDGPSLFRVVLVTGRPGSGRTRVLRALRDDARSAAQKNGHQVLVGWHEPLTTAAHHDCAVLHDWLTYIFAGVDATNIQWLGEALLASGVVAACSHLAPLATLAAGFDLDLRLKAVETIGQMDSGPSADRPPIAARLPLALAAKLLSNLGSSPEGAKPDGSGMTANATPLVLTVDDFDFADAQSRDFVCELVRSRQLPPPDGATKPPTRPLTLILTTEDADRAEVLLGFRGKDQRPERVVSSRPTPKRQLKTFVKECVGDAEGALGIWLRGVCQSPFEVEVVLRYLHRQGLVTKPKSRVGWELADETVPPDSFRTDALNQTIALWLQPAMQQILETGALVGMSFVADFADAATKGRHPDDPPTGERSMWHQIRESDQDEVIIRCREVGGRELITFTSTLWRKHLRDRADDRALQAQRMKGLAEFYAAAAKKEDRYDDWVTAAGLASQVGDHYEAGSEYLNAARFARQHLSVDVAADRYLNARESFSLAAATHEADKRAKALTAMAFSSLQAVSLRRRSLWNPPADFAKEELKRVQGMLSQIQEAVGLLPFGPAIAHIEDLVLDLNESYLSEADKLAARRHSLAAHCAILQGEILLAGAKAWPTLPDTDFREAAREVEWRFAGALRDAEQGMAGGVRRFLVILSAAGMTDLLTHKAEWLARDRATNAQALDRVASRGLFHACRALLLLRRFKGTFGDPLAVSDVEEAEKRLRDCVPRIGGARLDESRDDVAHGRPAVEAGQRSVADLTQAWAAAVAPGKYKHMAGVHNRAWVLAAAMSGHVEVPEEQSWKEDIRTIAFAHDLFRDVEPSRILALFRELDVPGREDDPNSGRPVKPGADRDWIQPSEWTIPILLHGRLAAVFLDLVLEARSRLGTDRFSQIEHALATHTVGERCAPLLSRLLVVADTLEVLSNEVKNRGDNSEKWLDQINEATTADPSLKRAYRLSFEARVEYLYQIGTTPARATIEVLQER